MTLLRSIAVSLASQIICLTDRNSYLDYTYIIINLLIYIQPIPLRQVYNYEMTRRKKQGATLAVMTKAMGTIARQTELMGVIGLSRKDPYHNTLTENDSFWTTDMPDHAGIKTQTMSDIPGPLAVKKDPLEFRISEKTNCVRWSRLPVYLTAEGNIKGSSLESSGTGMMYCGPGHHTIMVQSPVTTSRRINHRAYTDNSFFVTQNHSNRGSRARTPSRRLSESEKNGFHVAQSKGWEPLTKSALLEHTRVEELQVPKVIQVPVTPYDEWNPSLSRATSSRAKGRLGSPTVGYNKYSSLGFSDASNHFYSKYSSLYKEFFGFPTKV